MKRHRRLRALIHLLVVLSIVWISPGAAGPHRAEAQTAGNFTYAYDVLGRLIAVTDHGTAASTASYHYDAAGNLTSITLQSATQLAIFDFTPHSARAGATIWISGTGFSATAGQNSVQFPSGQTATPTAASTTQLQVTVPTLPAGSSGPISVAVGGGTPVSSSASFTLAAPAPTITGVSTGAAPTNVVAVGGSATVSGTYFDTTLANNRLTLNNRYLNLNSVAVGGGGASTINATVPQGVGSGRVALTTPAGGFTTSDYFYAVPPLSSAIAPFTPTQVVVTSTLPINPAGTQNPTRWTGTVLGQHRLALFTFEGTAGQRMVVDFAGTTEREGQCGYSEAYVLKPDNTDLLAPRPVGAGCGLLNLPWDPPIVLPETGTYTLAVTVNDHQDPTRGFVITLKEVPADPLVGIAVGGPAVTLQLRTPGQNGRLTFPAGAGERVRLQVTGRQLPNPPTGTLGAGTDTCDDVIVTSHLGATVVPSTCLGLNGLVDMGPLPSTGLYTISVNPRYDTTPDTTLTLSTAPAVAATNTPTAGPSPTPTNTPSPTVTNTPNGSATATATPTRAATATPLTGPALNVRPNSVPQGGVVSVAWGGIPTPTSSDWIGLYRQGDPDSPAATATVTTNASADGQEAFPLPASASPQNDYQLRFFRGAGTGSRQAVSNLFAVVAATAVPTPTPGANLSLRPSRIAAGGALSAAWTGIASPHPNDRIGIYAPLDADTAPRAIPVALGQASGAVTVPVPSTLAPGTYELRLLSGVNNSRLAPPVPFVVTPAGGADRGPGPDLAAGDAALRETAGGGSAAPPALAMGGDRVPLLPLGMRLGQETVSPLDMGADRAPLLPGGMLRLGQETVLPWEGGDHGLPLLPGGLRRLGQDVEPPAEAAAAAGGAAYTVAPDAEPDEATWTPPTTYQDGLVRLPLPESPWRALPALVAPEGETAVAGQVLRLDDAPLAEVTLRLGDQETRSDPSGRFLLAGVPPGQHELVIDGRSASTPGRAYGVYPVRVDLAAGETTVLPYTIWLSRLDTAHYQTIPSPTTEEVVLTTPRIPGLEVRIAAGSVLHDHEGQVVTELGITALPQERPPFPLPAGSEVPVYFTIQPGGATILPHGAYVVYPNLRGRPPGARVDFGHYDPARDGWSLYGRGTVTADGRQVWPDPETVLMRFTGGSNPVEGPADPGPEGPRPGNPGGADPVDLESGLFVYHSTDLSVADVLPVSAARTYRPGDPTTRAFGVGTRNPYDLTLWSPDTDVSNYTTIYLILPDGARIRYPRVTAPGGPLAQAVFEHQETTSRYYGSQIRSAGTGWHLRLRVSAQ